MRSIGLEAVSYVGTTLLSVILGSHPRCRSVGHCYVFFLPHRNKNRHVVEKENVCAICNFLERRCSLNKLKDINMYPENAYDMIDLMILEKDQDIIIDSSSTTPWFRRSNPDQIVWVFRDPITLASSYKKKGVNLSYMIRAYNKKYKNASGLAIDYCNFVKETEELKALFNKVGLEYSSQYLEYWKYDNHMVGGNKGVILNYAKHHWPEKAEEMIKDISEGDARYADYYRKADGNFSGKIDILTDAERKHVEDKCMGTYKKLKALEICLI